MVHLLIIVLGIAAYVGSDARSDSTFFNFVLPIVCFVSVLYAMLLGVYLWKGKPLQRGNRTDEELRFLQYLNKDSTKPLP